jgi:hypothetical protein
MAKIEFSPTIPAWPNAAVVGMAWMELFQKGAVAWTDTSMKLARTFTETAATQAKVFAPMMKPPTFALKTPAPPVEAAKPTLTLVETSPAPVAKAKKTVALAGDAADDLASAGLKPPIPLAE